VCLSRSRENLAERGNVKFAESDLDWVIKKRCLTKEPPMKFVKVAPGPRKSVQEVKSVRVQVRLILCEVAWIRSVSNRVSYNGKSG
jgi:hypothetical protein